jgi:WD40 repeat protein
LDEATIDLDTEELYNDLAKLSLGPVEDPALYSEESTDGLPSYLFCQPCLAEGEDLYNQVLYPPIELDSDEDDDTALPPPQDDFLQDLMKLSSLQLEDDPDFQLHDMNPPDYQDDTPQHHHQQPAPPTSTPVRQEAWDAAAGMLEAFGVTEGSESKEKSCLGHKETIFGVTFSECGNFCATASQDSTVDVWDVEKNSLLASLKDHSKDYECLRVAWASSSWATSVLDRTSNFRYLLASSGADGTVRLWACRDPRIEQGQEGCWKSYVTMHHDFFPNESTPPPETEKKLETITEDGNEGEEKQPEEPDKPQVYALQFIDHWSAFNTSGQEKTNSFLMTSSDDYIHFWELDIRPASEQNISLENGTLDITSDEMSLKEVMSLHFGSLGHYGFGVNVCNVTGSGLQVPSTDTDTDTSSSSASASGTPFGGDRNPNNVIFVFDAAYCAENGLLGVALSDGSLRLINGRGICVSILNLPGCQSHLTSFSWDSTGTRLATSVATGHLITWQLDVGDVQGRGNTVATCTGIMEGGHQVGRPLFGSRYCGDDLLVSWSVDGSLCLWDSHSQGNVQSPMAILRQDENYPIYAVEVYKDSCIAVGGGSEGGFIGVPLYMYAYKSSPTVAKQSSLDGKVEATDQKLTASAIANDENATKQSEKTDKTSLPPSNQSLQQSNENSSTKLNVPKEDKDVTPLPAASKEDN